MRGFTSEGRPGLRRDLWRAVGVLVTVRLLIHLPLAGSEAGVATLFDDDIYLALFDVFAGGAASRFSVLALGLYPYFAAELLLRLAMPEWYAETVGEGEIGRQEVRWRVQWVTIAVSLVMGGAYLFVLARLGTAVSTAPLLLATNVVALTAGSSVFLWLSRQGGFLSPSLLISANVAAALPPYLFAVAGQNDVLAVDVTVRGGLLLLSIVLTILLHKAQRRVAVSYGRQRRRPRKPTLNLFQQAGATEEDAFGRIEREYSGSMTYIPITLNNGGVTPLLYLLAGFGLMHLGARLLAGATISPVRLLVEVEAALTRPQGAALWLLLFFVGVPAQVGFGLHRFDPARVSRDLQRQGGYIPGIRPGRKTRRFLRRIYLRVGWLAPLLSTTLVTLSALLYVRAGRPAAWALLLVPAMILPAPLLALYESVRARTLLYSYEGFIR